MMKNEYSVEVMTHDKWDRVFALPIADLNQVYSFVDYIKMTCTCKRIRIKEVSYYGLTSYIYFANDMKGEM